MSYLRGLGVQVGALVDLADAIGTLEDEEELAAFPCAEGVAVTVVSSGAWILFIE